MHVGNTRTLPAVGLTTLAALSMMARPAAAQYTTFYPTDATISSPVNLSAIVGYANLPDYNNRTNGTSPTISVVAGASFTAGMDVRNRSTVNVSGGSVNDGLNAEDGSTVNVSGGSVSTASAFSTGTINVTGGTVNTLAARDTSAVSISGGSLLQLDTQNTSVVKVGGGTFGAIYIEGTSTLVVTGGTFGKPGGVDFFDLGTGAFTFVGVGLSAVATGTDPYYNGTDYTLTGKLQNGQSVTGDVVNVASGAAMFTLAAPEPPQSAVLGLGVLGLGALAFKARRRKGVAQTAQRLRRVNP